MQRTGGVRGDCVAKEAHSLLILLIKQLHHQWICTIRSWLFTLKIFVGVKLISISPKQCQEVDGYKKMHIMMYTLHPFTREKAA